jgi:hypothetical protein
MLRVADRLLADLKMQGYQALMVAVRAPPRRGQPHPPGGSHRLVELEGLLVDGKKPARARG